MREIHVNTFKYSYISKRMLKKMNYNDALFKKQSHMNHRREIYVNTLQYSYTPKYLYTFKSYINTGWSST